MEKKTKKLQLRKETIAVLNGERMSHVVGGVDQSCFATAEYGLVQNPADPNGPGMDGCFCQDGYVYDPFQNKCIPLIVAATVVSFMVCPTFVVTQCTCPK